MQKTLMMAGLICLALSGPAPAMEQAVVQSEAITWGDAPPMLPPGAQAAVLSGDPSKADLYVLRLRVPAGYAVPAHSHPTDENVTVLSGSFNIGVGDKLDEANGWKLGSGGYVRVEQGMNHYAWFTEPSIIQVHGMGPVEFIYVDPADDPRNATTGQKN